MNKYMRFLFLILPCISISVQGQENNVIEYMNLSYLNAESLENDSLQKLNLTLPKNQKNVPLLIWIGGGAWSYVDRSQEMSLARKLGEAGIAVASIGHRLSPATWKNPNFDKGIQHPKHIEDIASSVKWLHDHAIEYGYDLNNIFIGGYSSGAHLASLISLDNSYLNMYGLKPSIFKGIISISGTYDLVDYNNAFLNGSRPELSDLHVKKVFGQSENDLIGASPITYIKN
ncbi:alpha/beta hydrolase, partial [Fulvivirga lutimaris]|uniref:alpha/beta hydrolase n=1 Tax=Fulvivirga lutimaris TaxID=1819566 RepID=UPI0012BCDB7B